LEVLVKTTEIVNSDNKSAAILFPGRRFVPGKPYFYLRTVLYVYCNIDKLTIFHQSPKNQTSIGIDLNPQNDFALKN